MGAERVRKRVVVWGRVQGVWFRESVRRRADLRGVTGWVRNRPDGAVEAAFEGEPEAVEALVDFCRLGPPDARVDGVDQQEEPVEGSDRFEVR